MNAKEYRIGQYKFIPERRLLLSLKTDDDFERKLDGKQTAILLYFVSNSKMLISRALLAENVWSGRFVSDHAINTKISELRKLFVDDYKKPKYLKTHHQRGYELVADCEQLSTSTINNQLDNFYDDEELPKTNSISKGFSITNKFWLFLFLLSIIFTLTPAIHVLSNTSENQVKNNLLKLLPLTIENGQEWSPNVSFDGKILAYSQRESIDKKWHVNINYLNKNEIIQLKDIGHDLFSPYISKSNKLFFIKNPPGLCEIWFVNLSNNVSMSNAKFITSCGDLESMSPIAVGPNNEWLYFSKAVNKTKFQITRYHIDSGLEELLTIPSDKGFGDYTFALSPDGTKLAFLRSVADIHTKLMILDISTRELMSFNEFNHKMYKLSWDSKGKYVSYINQENTLEKLDVDTKAIYPIFQFQNKTLAPYITQNDETYIINGDFYINEIISMEFDFNKSFSKERIEVSSSYDDFAPVIDIHANYIYFTSDRTGAPQIWAKNKNKEFKITSFQNGYNLISDKQVSLDGSSLLFLKNQTAHIINLDTKIVSSPLIEYQNSKSPIWSCKPEKVLLSAENNGTWNLYEIDLLDKSTKKIMSDVIGIKADCINSKYYIMHSIVEGIFELSTDFDEKTRTVLNEYKLTNENWRMNNGDFYFLNKNRIVKVNLKTGVKKEIELPFGNYISFTIDKNKLFLSKRRFRETFIKQLVKD
jgi:DNA-binding winged helix-turn-helix (wHTH) protein/Tol biopolymer transport system component